MTDMFGTPSNLSLFVFGGGQGRGGLGGEPSGSDQGHRQQGKNEPRQAGRKSGGLRQEKHFAGKRNSQGKQARRTEKTGEMLWQQDWE